MATSAWLIARAAQHPPVLYLLVAVVAVRTFGLGRAAVRYVERLLSHDAAFRLLSSLRQQLVAHLARIAPAGLRTWGRGELLTRMVADVDDVGDGFLRGLLPLGGTLLVGTGTVSLITGILPAAGVTLGLALLVACGVMPALSARYSARSESASVGLRGDRGQLVGDILDELTDLTLGGLLPARLAELAAVEHGLQHNAARSARTAGIGMAVSVLAMGGAVVSAALTGIAAVDHRGLQPVLLAVIVLVPLALTEIVQTVGPATAALQRSFAAIGRLTTIFETPPLAPAPRMTRRLVRGASGPVIVLHDVSARWPGSEHNTIEHINLELVPGRRVVILGPSGCGKSTLLAVLLGFLPTSAGTITVDGIDVTDLDPDQVRTLFSWCDQEAYLFDSTLAENIRLARPAAGDDDVESALRDAGAGEWLASLPQGLTTPVGEHGSAVSGGQRQRIALARAILAGRPVFLADEPTAHLDGPTAEAITRLILRPDSTRCTVLVTHRESDAALGDVVLRLDRQGLGEIDPDTRETEFAKLLQR